MPTPNQYRDTFVRYLRTAYPHGEPWIGPRGYRTAEQVTDALDGLKRTDRLLFQILHLFTATHLTRRDVCKRVGYEYSTIKRKVDSAVDCVLNRLAHPELLVDAAELEHTR